MSLTDNQMGLFEMGSAAPTPAPTAAPTPAPGPTAPPTPAPGPAVAPAREATPPEPRAAKPAPAKRAAKKVAAPVIEPAPAARKISGLVPEGDVRLTANIRQGLHLKLKIASAHRRTTIGEILEELIEKHL